MTNDHVRLHITPFNAELLDRIVPRALQASARNISFHTVQTFPERGFGYVELPAMEAQKLKKKLNGSTLKGTKIQIEDAQPLKVAMRGEDAEDSRESKRRSKRDKSKRVEGVVPGFELENGRRVKRGWTEEGGDDKKAKKKQKRADSSRTTVRGDDERKLQFKTKVPSGVASKNAGPKEATDQKRKSSKKRDGKTIVQEFSKSVKLKDSASTLHAVPKSNSTYYEDGKGWINEDGTVVEEEPTSRKHKRGRTELATASSLSENKLLNADEDVRPTADSDSVSEKEGVSESSEGHETEDAVISPGRAESAKDIHPLEALFKRPASDSRVSDKPKPAPIDTSFSFFNADAAESDGGTDERSVVPQTPHTRKDLEWRSIRSAAPTPDTAAIGRHFVLGVPSDDDDDDDDDEEEEEVSGAKINAAPPARVDASEARIDSANIEGKGEESAFRKWFYENRGDLNRGWKKRRREEKKAKRKRENRILNRKIA